MDNIVLITVDCLRANHLKYMTKTLKKEPKTIFTNAFSNAPETAHSVSSFLTSCYPPINHSRKNIADILKERNYATAAFVPNAALLSLSCRNLRIGHGFDIFKPKIELIERKNIIGYVGRISAVKGVRKFVKAVPLILKERDVLEFLIVGDGPLLNEIKNELKNTGSSDKIGFTGWTPHNELPECLNKLKLLVLPSYTEGLPTIIQEAMACGAPVLATPVGGIADLIKDGETGFIMENNSPECIAENIIRALEHPNLEKIVKNARELIEKDFTYEAAVERYRKILGSILGVKNDIEVRI